jgi:hypothetical protein
MSNHLSQAQLNFNYITGGAKKGTILEQKIRGRYNNYQVLGHHEEPIKAWFPRGSNKPVTTRTVTRIQLIKRHSGQN